MIVFRFLEKFCVDLQILVDIFINYDCDVNLFNIFERYVVVILFYVIRLENFICSDNDVLVLYMFFICGIKVEINNYLK